MKNKSKPNNQLELFDLYSREDYSAAKPFLKWAGGKSQLITEIENVLPTKLRIEGKFTYIEPFVGSGAILFHLLRRYYHKIDNVIINDINSVLISIYIYLRDEPINLINELWKLKKNYYKYDSENDRKLFYLEQRNIYNSLKEISIKKAALMVFLNKTCFNGLYRVNSRNEFNVPFGQYKNPSIFDESVLLADSYLLKKVTILETDFEETLKYGKNNTLFYFDPPYKPISKTSSFKSYSTNDFNDEEQKRLKNFCDRLTKENMYFILSNSDVKNVNENDNFFDDLYSAYRINRVNATRSINSDSKQRGQISELLITNENHFKVW